VAAVSLTDSDRQWFKSRVGVEHTQIPRFPSPCSIVTDSTEVLVVEDMLLHPKLATSLLADNGVRFYATMIRMSHALGYRVVAEGVETADVVVRLRELDCDEVQGYLFARPMPRDVFATWMEHHLAGSADAQAKLR
jgi:hypothetical protein